MAVVILHPAARRDEGLSDLPTITAPHPNNFAETVLLEVPSSTMQTLDRARRLTTIFQAWCHLANQMPPVNNATHYLPAKYPNCKISHIAEARACFKGVKRPYGLDDDGEQVYVYIINSDYTVRWAPDMACVADIRPVPEGSVLTVQVRLVDALQVRNEGIWGMVTKWEFVRACPEHPTLPVDFRDRYTELLWQR